MARDASDLIRNKMRRQEITQQDIGDEFGICGRAVGYERATKAIQDHVNEEDKDEIPIQDSIGR